MTNQRAGLAQVEERRVNSEDAPSNGAPSTRSLHKKLAEIMAGADRIPKKGRAPASMGGFEFAQVGDVADAIRKALGERNVTMLPSTIELLSQAEHATKSGGTMTTESYRITWTFTDGDSGETFSVQSVGTGADTGDKAAPKAQTNALKYGLLLSFLLSTGDDPELSDSSDRRARRTEQAVERAGFAPREPAPDPFNAGLIGTAKASGNDDFELRQGPNGSVLPFRLAEGRKSWKVVATGVLADLIAEDREGIKDQTVTCWGVLADKSFQKDGKTITYQILNLSRLKVGVLDLSAPDEEPPEDQTDQDFEAGFFKEPEPAGVVA